MEFHNLRFPQHNDKAVHKSDPPFKELYAELENRRDHQGIGNYHQRKKEFLRWFEHHKTHLESPSFKSYYIAREQAKEAEHKYFTDLNDIQIDYTYSLTSVADWQTVLERSYKDEAALLNLAREFLIEIAIHESAFFQVYGNEFETDAFKRWSQKNHEFIRALSVINMGGLPLHTTHERDRSRAIITDVRARPKQQDISSEQLQLMHQEVKRLSGSGRDLELARSRASVIAHHVTEKGPEQPNPPWLLDGVRRALQLWHDPGRHLNWDPLALLEIQKSKESLELIAQTMGDEGSKDEENYAGYLWHQNKHGFYKP